MNQVETYRFFFTFIFYTYETMLRRSNGVAVSRGKLSSCTKTYFGYRWISIILLSFFTITSLAQTTHLSNSGIYDFLDELAGEQIIELSSLVKPYSRIYVAEKLNAADSLRDQLTTRQQSELDFYLRDYGKELSSIFNIQSAILNLQPGTYWLWNKKGSNKRFDVFYYRDSAFQITVNPVIGSDMWVNENGSFYHWWNGLEATASYNGWSFYASLRDNHESTALVNRDFMNDKIGGANFKNTGDGRRDYEEMRGGFYYTWKWGHIGIIKDQFSWGESYAGANILSGRSPSFARVELGLKPAKWFEFSYFHGTLVSEVVDSSKSFWVSNSTGVDYREVYHTKYMAANMFTFIPLTSLQLSVGNSVVYDMNNPHLAYMIPFMFFKAVDHTLNAGIDNMNSSMFFSVSSRNLRNFHFYASVFIDELQVGRINEPDKHNFVSYKGGVATYLLPNTRVVAEYTWTNALAFMHYVPTTTFESNQYNLGHYLEDNAKDLYLAVDYHPWRTLNLKAYLNTSLKGPDHTELGTTPRDGITPFEPIAWESTKLGFLASMQIINDAYVRLGYEWRNVSGQQAYIDRWTSGVYHGKTSSWRFGVNYGF